MKGLTDIPGILVGHASDYDGLTGCTVMLCESGAVAGGDIRGSGTGTEEWDVLNPLHVTDHIHAVVFAGRSAFGLEAASGVRRFLEHKGVGFALGGVHIPIVPCAILFDLGMGKSSIRPTREMGEAAAAAATDTENCSLCHINSTEQNDLLLTGLHAVTDPQGPINPIQPISSACSGCHVDIPSASHMLSNTTVLGEACAVCHSSGAIEAVDQVHAQY